jgi:ATP-dependent phosphofructokinase / diphosphate-dependent phosphofructokinase
MATKNTPNKKREYNRVGMIFSGGPAPGANAVISSCAISFLDAKIEVLGFLSGYANLMKYDHENSPMYEKIHYRSFVPEDVIGLRNSVGVLIGTSRANPGKSITSAEDLQDPEKNEGLRRVYNALIDLGVDALITIGGDDTLRTSNLLRLYQGMLPKNQPRIPLVHLPKTIDNDYHGIDFTFGYFTAINFLSKELLNIRADAESTNAYFICEVMGRKAGWLTYGVGIAGEANMILSTEDIDGQLNIEELAERIVDLIVKREQHRKRYGTIVIAEGLVDLLPEEQKPKEYDSYGNPRLGAVELGKHLADVVTHKYKQRRGTAIKIVGKQLGYECRCSPPLAQDVILGSQLGIGAYRALVEQGHENVMVSVNRQFELQYIDFIELVNAETLITRNRYISRDSDFYSMARFLESRTERPR